MYIYTYIYIYIYIYVYIFAHTCRGFGAQDLGSGLSFSDLGSGSRAFRICAQGSGVISRSFRLFG